ncbi:MAG: hypothetical protein EOP68_05685, partial [Sphingomonas sp.]
MPRWRTRCDDPRPSSVPSPPALPSPQRKRGAPRGCGGRLSRGDASLRRHDERGRGGSPMTPISPDRIRAIEARRDELSAQMATGDL